MHHTHLVIAGTIVFELLGGEKLWMNILYLERVTVSLWENKILQNHLLKSIVHVDDRIWYKADLYNSLNKWQLTKRHKHELKLCRVLYHFNTAINTNASKNKCNLYLCFVVLLLPHRKSGLGSSPVWSKFFLCGFYSTRWPSFHEQFKIILSGSLELPNGPICT